VTSSPRAAVRRLALTRLISITGGAAAYTALMFTIFSETHSAAWLTLAALATFGAEGLFGPVGGILGDRLDRKRLMVVCELIGAVCFGAMALVHSPGSLVLFSFLSALAEPAFISASAAAIPNLVGDDQIAWANGTVSLGRNLGILVGPLVGGLLVSRIGAQWVFAINAISFAVSAGVIATVSGRFADPARERRHGLGLRPGFRYLRQERVLWTVTIAWTVLILGFGMALVADVPLVQSFGAGSLGFGLLIAFWGGGTATGSIASRRMTAAAELPSLAGGMLVAGAMGVLVWLAPWFWVVLAATLLMGIGDSVGEVATRGLLQRRTPDELRSRVSAAADGIINTSFAVSFLLGGVTLNALGPKPVYALGGITCALGALVVLRVVRTRPVGVAPAPAAAMEPGPLITARTPLTSPGDPPGPARA